jgi:16S rRNA (uracil1498-N3)-methyltransferase
MHIPRVYYPGVLDNTEYIVLNYDAFANIIKSLRRKIGDKIIIFNGHGGEYEAIIHKINKRDFTIKIIKC